VAADLAAWGGNASAADLGSNCCADLEARIAELEATTARKVSLTVSGWVAEQVMWWDDGLTKAPMWAVLLPFCHPRIFHRSGDPHAGLYMRAGAHA